MAAPVEPLYNKRYQCLFCGREFTNKKLRLSRIRQVRRDSDLCAYFEGENPYFYEVMVCPHCGYAFTATSSPVKKEHREAIKEEYISKISRKDYTGPRTLEEALNVYKLALLCGNLNQEKPSVIAGLCLHIAWFYRYNHDEGEEKKYLRYACDLYQKAYEKESGTGGGKSPNLISYLIGELEGRLGNYEAACRWLGRLVNGRNLEPYLRELLQERWTVYREKLAETHPVEELGK
ncbi:DUF2225 domain-containing protein [Moorella sp. Hama-1]|uniref:DUF2225 domain-containing protein n=1 Tax=Moorella sp. Hama-1 TaxID=2138101 RepID=UPI000D65DE8F|nr:DUF2225 domain-containing protein [Moorella sp. Hama-1]MDN5362447.1 uncharacterized protein [Moorella sp. (in: firmicutes)]BCV21997.1 hypothetical protein hamaS1_20660 [Moorella sp. Hama-1]